MEIENRLEKLSEQAKERNLNSIHEAKTKKQAQWLAIQEKTPETAEFLKLFSASFGKPVRLRIVVNNEIILEI
jgi:hypothetical protein